MFWLIPAICALIAAICTIVGVVAVLKANGALQARQQRLRESLPQRFDRARLAASLERIRRDAESAKPLLERATTAVQTIGDGFRALRLREAVMALRLASAALRALAALSLVFAIGVCAFALTACSSASPVAPIGLGADAQASRAASARLFVSTGRANQIQIYDAYAPHTLVGQITDGLVGPNGQAVDSTGNLFVANADGGSVTVYAPGTTKPFKTYRKDLTNPLTPVVGGDDTLYVSNFNGDGSGEILEFPPNQLSPSFKIPLKSGANGLALDAHGNLYASVFLNNAGRILKFAPKSKKGTDLGITLNYPGRLAVDPSGNLIACDQTAPAVEVFPPGATKPSKEITTGFVDPFAVALDKHVMRLYVADGAGDVVNVYSYPGLHLRSVIRRSAASFGLSVSPAAPP